MVRKIENSNNENIINNIEKFRMQYKARTMAVANRRKQGG